MSRSTWRTFTGLLFAVCVLPEYEAKAEQSIIQNIRTADWSTAVAPFGMW